MEYTSPVAQENLTLKTFLALFCADVDIFLLKDIGQEVDKDKLYTPEEIRSQLMESFQKFCSLNDIIPPNIMNMPFMPVLKVEMLKQMGFSNAEIKEAQKNAKMQIDLKRATKGLYNKKP